MAHKPIRITVRSSDVGNDAPTVHDLLGQVDDFVKILEGVEEAIAPEDGRELEWRVTDAKKNSPLTVEITPFPINAAMNIDRRTDRVEAAAFDGLSALGRGTVRPMYFTDKVLARAKSLHARVQNGLAETIFKADRTIAAEPLVLNRTAADSVQRGLRTSEDVDAIPYKEIGSLEGFIGGVELDGRNRAILTLRSRINGAHVKVFARDRAVQQLGSIQLRDVWRAARVRAFGLLHFKRLGVIEYVDATKIEMLDVETLPTIDDIIDPTFAAGLTTEEYLERLRRD